MLRRATRLASSRGAGLLSQSRLVTVRPAAGLLNRGMCTVNFTFIEDGEEVPVTIEAGKTILEAAHANEVDLEGGLALRA